MAKFLLPKKALNSNFLKFKFKFISGWAQTVTSLDVKETISVLLI